MTRDDLTAMDDDSLQAEIDHLQSFFDDCAVTGQGISTKESVRMRRLKAERGNRMDTRAA